MKVFIEDGPHEGQLLDVPWVDRDVLILADPGTSILRPTTRQQYRRTASHPSDFARGIEARFRWDP